MVKKVKELYNSIPSIFKNKYALLFAAFAVYMLLFAKYDVPTLYKSRKALNELKDKQYFYETKIQEIREYESALFNNQEALERYAREKYMMKKDDEDLFVFVKK